jgi:hypothetical protein
MRSIKLRPCYRVTARGCRERRDHEEIGARYSQGLVGDEQIVSRNTYARAPQLDVARSCCCNAQRQPRWTTRVSYDVSTGLEHDLNSGFCRPRRLRRGVSAFHNQHVV